MIDNEKKKRNTGRTYGIGPTDWMGDVPVPKAAFLIRTGLCENRFKQFVMEYLPEIMRPKDGCVRRNQFISKEQGEVIRREFPAWEERYLEGIRKSRSETGKQRNDERKNGIRNLGSLDLRALDAVLHRAEKDERARAELATTNADTIAGQRREIAALLQRQVAEKHDREPVNV